MSGTWVASAIQEKLGDNYGCCKLPTFTCDGKQVQMGSFLGCKIYGVNSQTAYPVDSMELAEYLTSEKAQIERYNVLNYGPSNVNALADDTIASNLAFIGSIKDDILDVEELAMNLLDEVRRNYPDLVAQRYKLDAETLALPPYELMEAIGRKRGLLVRGGEVNTERCAIMLVDEFRACKWGRISLERPPQRDDLVDFSEEDEE